jgi:purine-binding chemotaxis protein CheW
LLRRSRNKKTHELSKKEKHGVHNQIMVFELGSEEYRVNNTAVERIIKLQAITRMPHATDFIEGVTNLCGKVLPVIDLRKRFGMDS